MSVVYSEGRHASDATEQSVSDKIPTKNKIIPISVDFLPTACRPLYVLTHRGAVGAWFARQQLVGWFTAWNGCLSKEEAR